MLSMRKLLSCAWLQQRGSPKSQPSRRGTSAAQEWRGALCDLNRISGVQRAGLCEEEEGFCIFQWNRET